MSPDGDSLKQSSAGICFYWAFLSALSDKRVPYGVQAQKREPGSLLSLGGPTTASASVVAFLEQGRSQAVAFQQPV
ncbi:MAG: hypothetical protein B7Y33_04255, partial [Hydrogenophilales bacterium 16-62-9]